MTWISVKDKYPEDKQSIIQWMPLPEKPNMDINIQPENAMEQAASKAEYYLDKAYDILKQEYEEWTVRDAIELAKVMAQDFHTTMTCMKMQEIRDVLNRKY